MKFRFVKIFLVAFIVLTALFCFADKWQDDYDSADYLYKDGFYEDALEEAEELMEFTKKEFGVNSPEMGHAYNLLGLINSKMGNFENSEANFKKAITAFENAGKSEKSNVGILKSNLGDLYYQNFFDEEAQIYLEEAVKILEELKGYEKNLEVPYYDLYSIYYSGAYYADAADVLKKLVDAEKKNYGKNDTIVGVDLRNLGWVYVMWGKYSDGEKYMKEAIDVHLVNGGNNNNLLGLAYNDYGVLFDYKQEYGNALKQYEKAVEVFKKSKNDKELGNTYNNMGLAYQKNDQKKKSAEYYEKAYNIYKTFYGENDDNTIEVKENWNSVK